MNVQENFYAFDFNEIWSLISNWQTAGAMFTHNKQMGFIKTCIGIYVFINKLKITLRSTQILYSLPCAHFILLTHSLCHAPAYVCLYVFVTFVYYNPIMCVD